MATTLYVRSDRVEDRELEKVAQSFLEIGIIEKAINLDGLVYW
jgi:hypothetical protein